MFRAGDWVQVVYAANPGTSFPFPFPKGSLQKVEEANGVLVKIVGDPNLWSNARFRPYDGEVPEKMDIKVKIIDWTSDELWDVPA